jgi:vanadium-dependent haloperoxidase-like protein
VTPGVSTALTACLMVVGLTGPGAADVVTDWNEIAVAAGYTAGIAPPAQSRQITIVQLAVFEALNAIEPRYRPYRKPRTAEPDRSPELAAAAAAHYVLVRFYPDQAKAFDTAFQPTLDLVADAKARARSVELGEAVAAEVLAERKDDGADAPNTYRPFTTAGRYVPTVFPLGSRWGAVRPFVLERGDQFRPPAPYALTSAAWAKDFAEVKRMGAKVGSARSAEQTDIARFWEFVGPGTYFPMVRQVARAKGLDALARARLFALASMAGADAMIAVLDAKYTYNFWRPVTAIRNADLDGNEATEIDPAWEPLITTPMHPEYPCAHCITQTAVAQVLQAFFGDEVPRFTLRSPTAPGVERGYSRLSDYVSEVVNARVYDGVHYRTSGEVGVAMGRKIGQYVVDHALPEAAPAH